jgi:hypothetical protein
MLENCFSLIFSDHGGQSRDISLFHCLQATEVLQQPASGAFADAGDFA